ncbi:PREDICTED: uncharacterized protein LOC104608444 [Nelumbo nucifera]|uniref:Uncharacterized protein LOC104608444 n=2 Tax=Nelumbo nucifera TaxID=4432 RepID=A0A1U8B0Y4_NELNU|nr:PREDICTED: uncharacterized protein LOC104608444 [Nelumbo nucifera]DAD48107.1 TPA_asm: hypothetical protein HUJ06_018044 [Nelumbo nucifera]
MESSPLIVMEGRKLSLFLFALCSLLGLPLSAGVEYISAVGDPGMKRDGLRVAIEAWNQCNEVGEEAPNMGSPRAADCFDVDTSASPVKLVHKITERDNKLGLASPSRGGLMSDDVDDYAAEKEIYLGNKCQVEDQPRPWQFWMIMLKSGNMDSLAALCPENGKPSKAFPPQSRFPCFGKGCMNMPLIHHNFTSLQKGEKGASVLRGAFYGTWDLDADVTRGLVSNTISYYSVDWEKEIGKGSWVFHHVLKTSHKYPWLMLYLRSDATTGFSGGYHYPTRGMSKIIPKSPNFKVRFTLDIKKGGSSKSQFYLMDIGSCWKNNGQPCDGDVTTDVTRYSEMIINPRTESWCRPDNLKFCPPYHTLPNGKRIHRTDKAKYPYEAYHMYCAPGHAQHVEEPYNLCDPYGNPQAQEVVQTLPHPVWGEYGYPTKKGEGWIGDARTWDLDVGRLSQSLYFYQDPGTKPVDRYWPSINVGTEIYISENEVAEWTVSGFEIVVPKDDY